MGWPKVLTDKLKNLWNSAAPAPAWALAAIG